MGIVCGCTDGGSQPPVNVSPQTRGTPKIRYSYDALGRLIQASSDDGTGVQYTYDAVGNITSVRRLAVGVVKLLEFEPRAGATGSEVTIYGSGFDPNPIGNTVAFNGVSAAISAATATKLTVNVPTNATTGSISVTNTSGGAISADVFTVDGSSPAPTIVDFTPQRPVR
jgi:YD repeat-containing protein